MSTSNLLTENAYERPYTIEALEIRSPYCIWLTGLSGAGKSSIAEILHNELIQFGQRVVILDGDVLRGGLNKNLGFSREDRAESVRRAAEAANLMMSAGLTVIVALISPFRDDREQAMHVCPTGSFIEVYVNTDLETCEQRDPKDLYKKARQGLIPEFTGIDSPYEPPLAPHINLSTDSKTPLQSAQEIIDFLAHRNI
ncbi:adenylyl-sulfate kinase [Aquirhabdus sp.]|uniref:adenylyl-sulfate kinase n=1 Tax=Aquirhabdus sp. TaxID=2824160 RepID=UPI00396C67F1